MRRVTVLLLLVAALAACTPPQPAPAPPTTSAAAPTPRVQLPPRPRDIPLDDIDPCTLLTETQRAELDLNGDPRMSSEVSPLYGPSVSCTIVGTQPRRIGVGVTFALQTGIERFTVEPIQADLTPIDVLGYPAVVARSTLLRDFCSVEIDVAPDQLIDIQYGEGVNAEPFSQDELCEKAVLTATRAMMTLLAL